MQRIDTIIGANFLSVSEQYTSYAKEKDQCRQCELYNCYQQVVQSEGCTQSPIFMFVGECPGNDEVEQNKPFIGKAGQRLRKELKKYRETFNKSTTIISNDNKFPSNPDSPDKCVNLWLYREINLLKPKVIITLGNRALWYVREEKGVTEYRGNWKFLNKFRAWSMATFHPSYVIRKTDKLHIEKQFEDDIKSVVDRWKNIISNDLRMSISEDEWKRQKAIAMAIAKGMINVG
jgi:uracil-DNA glycosylase